MTTRSTIARPRVGRWCIETEKGTRLYIVNIAKSGRVEMAYRPQDPIAVSATREDFARFFEIVE